MISPVKSSVNLRQVMTRVAIEGCDRLFHVILIESILMAVYNCVQGLTVASEISFATSRI
jgi:hypothetical protein